MPDSLADRLAAAHHLPMAHRPGICVSRRRFLLTAGGSACALSVPWLSAAQPAFTFDPSKEIIPAPEDPALFGRYRELLQGWRERERQVLNYSDALYRRADFSWVPGNFACFFLMLNDERFWEVRHGRYRVKELAALGQREWGGFDSIVLWHAYPRIGLDYRNQFDFYRDMPGGLDGLRSAVNEFHRLGIHVYLDYNPWDTGTRREDRPDIDVLVDLVGRLEADGIFLDTMNEGAAEFRAKLDAVRSGVVLEGEIALPLSRVHDHHMSWAQWFKDNETPGVLRNKWFERRHMMHQIQRWNRDHSGELHTAWMNGAGMLIWDNIFGTWNGWNERDKSILRSLLPIQRRYVSLFSGEGWVPLLPTLLSGTYASLWQGQGIRLWTLINRSHSEAKGDLLEIQVQQGERLWDLVTGTEIPTRGSGLARISGTIRSRGVGCFLAGEPQSLGRDFARFLRKQQGINSAANWDAAFPGQILCMPVAVRRPGPGKKLPSDMVEIPGGLFPMRVEFRARECGYYQSFEPKPPGTGTGLHKPVRFERDVVLKPYAMDLTPVTNEQFAAFLKASEYQPKYPANFLRHWVNGAPPSGREDHPVVYVDLGDARAYAQWAGKRLPTEEEWQFAAQGRGNHAFPWGDSFFPEYCNGNNSGTTPVRQFPQGRSPFGIYDLCGNTWEWTESERSDGITRFCIIRGGSYYKAQGSDWYMDGGPCPAYFAAKFPLMWPGLDRCGTIGFRCAADLPEMAVQRGSRMGG